MTMKVVIPGGSGQVGHVLARAFRESGDEVVVLARSPGRVEMPARVVGWDGKAVDDAWASEIDGADAVINLAGRSVNCRYTPENRRAIMDSRVDSTRAVGAAIARAARPPKVWLQAATATIYDHRHDAPNDEATGLIGTVPPGTPDSWQFSLDVATAWEATLGAVDTPQTRKVALRSSMIMSPDKGGVFDVLLGLVRVGLGGRSGDGRQFMSWIIDRDFVAALRFLIDRDDLSGPVNVCSPNPLPNADFMADLRRAWGIGFGLPATDWMIEVGTFLMRTESELVLKSRRVAPGRLAGAGFAFEFPEWPAAAADLCRRWREARR